MQTDAVDGEGWEVAPQPSAVCSLSGVKFGREEGGGGGGGVWEIGMWEWLDLPTRRK